jgi:hypothetical protein
VAGLGGKAPKGVVVLLLTLLLAAWVARQVYDLLAPMVPGLLVIVGLVALLALLTRVRRS